MNALRVAFIGVAGQVLGVILHLAAQLPLARRWGNPLRRARAGRFGNFARLTCSGVIPVITLASAW